MTTKKHPTQPVILDEHGTPRFQQNAIVRKLLDRCTDQGFSLNEIAVKYGNKAQGRADYDQLMQLIGYSTSGYGELSTSPTRTVASADLKARRLLWANNRKVS